MSHCQAGPDAKPKRDRRKYQRVPVNFPVNYLLSSSDSKKHAESAIALDISPGGLLLKTLSESFKKGQKLYIYPDFSTGNSASAPIEGKVRWVKKDHKGCLNGISIENTESLLQHCLNLIAKRENHIKFLDAILDSLSEPAFLVDSSMAIISLSKKQPLVPVDRDKVRGKKLTEIPSILKLFPQELLNLKQDLQEVFYTRADKQHRTLPLEYGAHGDKETYFFNIIYKYINSPPFQEVVFIQIKDVTTLCRLKEYIEEKNKSLFEQYRLTLMGHIVDELLEDIISPLSAVVGRIDLLKMKMARFRRTVPSPTNITDWLSELETIDGLVDQITQHCTVAAKRREREKLGAFQQRVSLNKIVQETLTILGVHERFKKIDVSLELEKDLPEFDGEYFDWLNALIALVQHISREMQTLHEKKLKIQTAMAGDHLVLSISHNAKALKVPLEREAGLAILDFIQKKYETAIEAIGGNGRQKISFFIPLSQSKMVPETTQLV